ITHKYNTSYLLLLLRSTQLIIPPSTTLTLVYLFFIQRYAYHRDLHSFPTRRSSDLFKLIRCNQHSLGYPHGQNSRVATPYHAGRSEEHTSELQSRGHLVCRLLLEKKNQQIKVPEALFTGASSL